MPSYLRVQGNIRNLVAHPDWRIGETPETARLLNDTELAEHGFYVVVDNGPPQFDPLTERAVVADKDEWQIVDGQAIKSYVIEDLPPPSDDAINDERRRRIEEGAIVSITGYVGTVHTQGRSEDQINYMALKDTARDLIAANITAAVIPFRDKDNVDHLFTATQMIELVDKGKLWLSSIYQASWTIKAMDPRPMDITDDQLWPSYIVE